MTQAVQFSAITLSFALLRAANVCFAKGAKVCIGYKNALGKLFGHIS
jgi:hypothetical protein